MITRLRILRDVRMPSLSRSAGVPADSDVARSSVGPWSISANVVDDPCVDDASAPSAHDTGLDEADIESDAAAVPDPDVETASDVGSSDIGQEEAVERVNSAVTPALRYRRLADLRYRRRLVTQNPTAGTELVDLSEGGAPEGDAPEADVPDGDAARAGAAEVSVDSHSVELAPANAANATSAPEGREQAAPPLGAGRIRRVPALDGLRGIAVLVVVLYHFFGAAVRAVTSASTSSSCCRVFSSRLCWCVSTVPRNVFRCRDSGRVARAAFFPQHLLCWWSPLLSLVCWVATSRYN